MNHLAARRAKLCRVLEFDVDLAEAVPLAQRAQATVDCVAREASIATGRWHSEQIQIRGEGIGLLVLSGLLIRRVGIDARFGAELLGEGDLLRPWQEDELTTLPIETGWRVLEPVRVALLDEMFARCMAGYPQLSGRLVARTLRRSRDLAINMAIVHQARVDVRLHMLLWRLAARWGRVRGDGVSLPLKLTHNVLADLTAAQRPTVSSALSELVKQDLVRVAADGWLLIGRPPGELLELTRFGQTLID